MVEWGPDFLPLSRIQTKLHMLSPQPASELLPTAAEGLGGHFRWTSSTEMSRRRWHFGTLRRREGCQNSGLSCSLPAAWEPTSLLGLGGRGSHALPDSRALRVSGSSWKGQPCLAPPSQQVQQSLHVHKSSGSVPKLDA